MGQNFLDCDREQAFLLPPSLRDWLPEDHLAWFVIDSVGGLDLAAFYAAYRADGHGRAAYEPSMMVALVLYGYATSERSSRGIERRCREDIAYRVITGNQTPDHATVARFIRRHQESLNELFGSVLRLCARAGLVDSGVVAVDGTKLTANASSDSNIDYDRIAREIIEGAIATDAAEDARFGEARGDELPPELRTAAGRRAWLERELQREREQPNEEEQRRCQLEARPDGFEQARAAGRGRIEFIRQARRELEEQRWQQAKPVPRSRAPRLRLSAQWLEEELAAELRGADAYGQFRRQHPVGGRIKPYLPPEIPEGEVNLTDPDSRRMKGNRRFIQGYNAQAVVNEQQIVLAAEVTTAANDHSLLAPMIEAAVNELKQCDSGNKPAVVLADAQYWNAQHIDRLVAEHGCQVLIPPDGGKREGPPRRSGPRYALMRAVLATELGKQLYSKRQTSIEPVFGHTKHNRKIDRFNYRGRSLVRTEWRIVMLTHNLQKLHRHQLALAAG